MLGSTEGSGLLDRPAEPGDDTQQLVVQRINDTARSIPRELQSHFAIARGIVGPTLAHLDEQEQMHGLLDQLRYFLARLRPDRPDGLAALTERDFSLALALDKDGLLDTYRTVAQLLPNLGLDRGAVRQFLMKPQIDFFPRDFRRQCAHRCIGNLV